MLPGLHTAHAGVDIEMHFDRAAAEHAKRGQVFAGLQAADLFLNVQLVNRLVHLRLERHAETEQGYLQPEVADGLGLRVGADADHVSAGLHGDESQFLQPMAVGIGLHDDAELGGGDEPPHVLDVAEELVARHEHFNVMLSHDHLLRVPGLKTRCRAAVREWRR